MNSKDQGWCDSIQALQSAGMKQHIKMLQLQELETDFLIMEFEVEAELIQAGYLHPDGSVKTFTNAHEIRLPKETFN